MLLKNCLVNKNKNELVKKDIYIEDGVIKEISDNIEMSEFIDCEGLVVMPGMIDVHVHLREPGYSNKETILTGTSAAVKGGFTTIYAMPNLNPVPSNASRVKEYLEIIKRDAKCNVVPLASITNDLNQEELTDFKELKTLGINAFSDDGRPVMTSNMMENALKSAVENDVLLSCHTEDFDYIKKSACLNEGIASKKHNVLGIPNEAEYMMIKRDLELMENYKSCKYHVCHLSCKESIELLKTAKDEGYNVSSEVTIHHLLLNENDVENTNHKMNPPLRSLADQEALLRAIQTGDIDIIASDHAPHTFEDKDKSFADAAFGITSLETSLALAYTYLVKKGLITLEEMIKLMSTNPAKRFSAEKRGELKEGYMADLVIVDLNNKTKIDVKSHVSKGKNNPFDNYEVSLNVKYTIVNGELVYEG